MTHAQTPKQDLERTTSLLTRTSGTALVYLDDPDHAAAALAALQRARFRRLVALDPGDLVTRLSRQPADLLFISHALLDGPQAAVIRGAILSAIGGPVATIVMGTPPGAPPQLPGGVVELAVDAPVRPEPLDACIAAALWQRDGGARPAEAHARDADEPDIDEPAPSTVAYASLTDPPAPRPQAAKLSPAASERKVRFKSTLAFDARRIPTVPTSPSATATAMAAAFEPQAGTGELRPDRVVLLANRAVSSADSAVSSADGAVSSVDAAGSIADYAAGLLSATTAEDDEYPPTRRLPSLMSDNQSLPTAVVGGHLLLSVLGRGGMATVYRARDVEGGRDVALKVLDRDRLAEKARLRFKREMGICQRLDHPNIVQTYAAGEWEERLYFTMELLDGQDLARELAAADGPLSVARVVDMGVQSCAGLQVAHEAGVLHRDIKPHNLFVTNTGVLKVTDFGVAKDGNIAMTLTGEGSVVGTPAYLAPERLQEGLDVSPRSDIYSLGATLYHLMTGSLPFQATDLSRMLTSILFLDVAPPSSLNPAVPAALDAVVLKAMARDPAHRFADCRAFAVALAAALG